MATTRQCIDAFIQSRVAIETAREKPGLSLDDPRIKEKYEFLTREILDMEEELRSMYNDSMNRGSISETWARESIKAQMYMNYKGLRDRTALRSTREIYNNTMKAIDRDNTMFSIASQLDPDTATKIQELEIKFDSEPNANARVNIRKEINEQRVKLVEKFPEAMEAMLAGSRKNLEGGMASLDAKVVALQRRYFGGFLKDLRKGGLEDIFFSNQISREVAKELENLTFRNKETGKVEVNPQKITNSKEARQIAEIVYKYQNDMLVRSNRAGNSISQIPGYITRQSHNIFSLWSAGKEKWVEFVKSSNLLDMEKTFYGQEGMTDPDIVKALGAVYDNIVAGNYRFGDFRATAPHRQLHFKGADAFMDYNDKYGSGSLIASVQQAMRRGAREIGLTELFGTDPRAAMDGFYETMSSYVENTNIPKVWNPKVKNRIEKLFKEFDGTTKTPADNMLSAVGRGVRAWMNVTKLGGATLSAMADLFAFSSEVRHQGDSLVRGYAKGFENLAKGRGKGVRQRVAMEVGVGFEGMIGQVLARFSPIDALPKLMNIAQQKFFKYSGLEWWTDAHKVGMANMMAHRLGTMRDLPFDKIDKDMSRLLKNYNIDDAKWNLIRKWAEVEGKMEDGNVYITPDLVRYISDRDVVKAMPDWMTKDKTGLGQRIADYKDTLETELRAFFIDRINHAVPTPGARTQALVHQGTEPGTGMGEAARFFWQFKSFPLTIVDRVWSRELYGKGHADIGGIAHILIASTVLGYGAMTAKDLSKGRKPREISEKPGAVFMAAFLQGGGGGIFGDFLFQGHTRYGQSKLESFMGPTYGTLSQVMRFAADDSVKFLNGEKDIDSYSSNAINIAKQNLPFINMWYSKWAVDYLMLYAIQEELNPGYFNRMNRNLKKNMATESFLQPGLGLY